MREHGFAGPAMAGPATNGLATAHVIRMVAPFTEKERQPHRHDVEFQMVYVLKGWFETEMEGHGRHRMTRS